MSTTYNGNSASYPTSLTIPSDGDAPTASSVNAAFERLADRTAHHEVQKAEREEVNIFSEDNTFEQDVNVGENLDVTGYGFFHGDDGSGYSLKTINGIECLANADVSGTLTAIGTSRNYQFIPAGAGPTSYSKDWDEGEIWYVTKTTAGGTISVDFTLTSSPPIGHIIHVRKYFIASNDLDIKSSGTLIARIPSGVTQGSVSVFWDGTRWLALSWTSGVTNVLE